MDEKYLVKSLLKAIDVLECFSDLHPELGVSEIAKMLELQKSTVFNILNTLEHRGYVDQSPQTGKYHLGLRVLHMSYIVNHHMGLREMFLPYLAQIAQATDEICYFGILDQREVLYIDSAYPHHATQTRNILGERAPLYCTGLGKAMLAHMPEPEAAAVLAGPFNSFTNYTLTDPAALRGQIARIREQGYAVDDMEHELGIRCVAAPVFRADGSVFAAVSVSGPSMRFDQAILQRDADIIRQIIQPLQRCL